MKTQAKIYTIKCASMHDGETVVAYTFADALRCACRHVGTQRGGIRTKVKFSHVCADATDYSTAYLDARKW
jgi:hypothetical protein